VLARWSERPSLVKDLARLVKGRGLVEGLAQASGVVPAYGGTGTTVHMAHEWEHRRLRLRR
jgi:hypothetical protein